MQLQSKGIKTLSAWMICLGKPFMADHIKTLKDKDMIDIYAKLVLKQLTQFGIRDEIEKEFLEMKLLKQ